MISKETIEVLKKNLKKDAEVWIYTKGTSGGGTGKLVDVTDEFIILEDVHRGRKFTHYFILETIESIKIYHEGVN